MKLQSWNTYKLLTTGPVRVELRRWLLLWSLMTMLEEEPEAEVRSLFLSLPLKLNRNVSMPLKETSFSFSSVFCSLIIWSGILFFHLLFKRGMEGGGRLTRGRCRLMVTDTCLRYAVSGFPSSYSGFMGFSLAHLLGERIVCWARFKKVMIASLVFKN